MKRSIIASEKSAQAAGVQADVAKKALADIERPYLFVFNVSGIKIDEAFDIEEGEIYNWLQVSYSVANHGKIPAIIKFAQAGLSVFTEPLKPPRLEYDHSLIVSPILAAGEVRKDIQENLQWNEFTSTEHEQTAPVFGDNDLWFWIIIAYRGPFSDQHETRVCWRYDGATGRFTGPFGGPEYSGEK
jgi:hypothetical protein